MLVNADTSKVMHVEAEYVMNDIELECVSEEKDLGVIISEHLKHDKQRSEVVRKANRILGMIKPNFVDRSKETISLLYKTPHLEYCCQIWGPYARRI